MSTYPMPSYNRFITAWPNKVTTQGASTDVDWSLLVELLSNASDPKPTKDQQPLWKGCTMVGNHRRASSQACDTHYFIIGDHDAGTQTPVEVINKLNELNVRGMVYTTASHTEKSPRWRVVVPVSEPFEHKQEVFELLVGTLNSIVGGALANESYSPLQAWYYGPVSQVVFEALCSTGTRDIDQCDEIIPIPRKTVSDKLVAITTSTIQTKFDVPISNVMLDALALALQAIPTDSRSVWMRMTYAMSTLRGTQAAPRARAIWLAWTKSSSKYKPEDDAVWISAKPSKTDWSVVFREALECGWVDSRPSQKSEVINYVSALLVTDKVKAYQEWAYKAAVLAAEERFEVLLLLEEPKEHPRRVLQKQLATAVALLNETRYQEIKQKRVGNRISVLFEPENTTIQAIQLINQLVATQPICDFVRVGLRLMMIKRSLVVIPDIDFSQSVKPPEAYQFIPHKPATLIGLAERVHVYERNIGMSKKSTPVEVPVSIIRQVEANQDVTTIPNVTALANHPFVLADGTIIQAAGLDPTTQIYITSPTTNYVPLTSLAECKLAYRELCNMPCFRDFAFAGSPDEEGDMIDNDGNVLDVSGQPTGDKGYNVNQALAVARLLHGIQRAVYADAPIFFFVAPVPGSGKTTLVGYLQTVITGIYPIVAAFPKNEEEMNKCLLAYVDRGVRHITLDNVPSGLVVSSPELCTYATTAYLEGRRLGTNEHIFGRSNAVIDIGGNGILPGGDLTSRSFIIKLDTNLVNAFERKYVTTNVYQQALINRPRTLALLVGILAWSNKQNTLERVESTKAVRFKSWDRDIRSSIQRLTGIDLAEILANEVKVSPETVRGHRLLSCISRIHRDMASSSEIATSTIANQDLDEILEEFPGFERNRRADGRSKSPKSVGMCLRKLLDVPTSIGNGTLTLRLVTLAGGYEKWRVESR